MLAFETFFRRYERQIFLYLWRMTADEQTAYDLSQETFVRAWQHFAEIGSRQNPKPWLYRVATNSALTFLRQRTRRPSEPLADDLLGASDPGRKIALRDQVAQVLLELPPRQRSVLVLHEVDGFTCDEIGAILGVSRDAVKMALWRAREHFRMVYLREEEYES